MFDIFSSGWLEDGKVVRWVHVQRSIFFGLKKVGDCKVDGIQDFATPNSSLEN